MSKFSRELEKYIIKSGLTENQLAKVSGFTRSYIALMKNGQRVSPDTSKLKLLLEALNLSPYEDDALWREYWKARYGEDAYELRMNMISFIESFGHVSKISIKSNFSHEIPEVKTIDNQVDLKAFVKAVIEQEALKPDGHIRMIIQEEFGFVFNLLTAICRSNQRLPVEHIVCLEGNDVQGVAARRYNLKTLGKLLPILLSGSENGYEIYYYYDKVSSHFSTSVLLPYLLLTSEYAVNISSNMENAMVFKDTESLGFFNQLFEERKKMCRKMLKKTPGGTDIFSHYMAKRSDSDTIYTIGSQPCFGVFPVDILVEKYMLQRNPQLVALFLELLEKNRSAYKSAKGMTAYFTKKGIQRLMDEGVISELPRELYSPLALEDRSLLLNMLISEIKDADYEAYLINDDKLSLPQELNITAYSFTVVDVVYMSERVETRFILEEQSLARTMYEFLAELKTCDTVFDREETLQYLESLRFSREIP